MSQRNHWRVIYDGVHNGPENMARDEAIMLSVALRKSLPTLRFYAWNPPTVTIGYFQSLEKEVDAIRCGRAGYGLVRRPTGGRAVLHDDEVTYSVSIREVDFPGTVVETYRKISAGLVAGLTRLGIDAQVQSHAAQKQRSSAACFDAPSWYEVVCSGKKIVGSAQVRKAGTILQHGSIPLTFSPERVVEALSLSSDMARKRLADHLTLKAAGLADFLGFTPTFDQVAGALLLGLAETLSIDFVVSSLTIEEEKTAASILAEKYGVQDWNRKR